MVRRTLTALALVGACVTPAAAAAADWTRTGDLTAPQRYRAASSVMQDGSVLAISGRSGNLFAPGAFLSDPTIFGGFAYRTAERFDPATNAWATLNHPGVSRAGASATTLGDGRVLVAGGEDSWGYAAQSETYNPATQTWTRSDNRIGHGRFRAVTLDDGRVQLVGSPCCTATHTGEIFDPATSTWTRPAPSTARGYPAVAVLNDGRVLVAGGETTVDHRNNLYDRESVTSAELYDPATNTWTPTGSTNVPRQGANAAVLPDGRVLVAGGWGWNYTGTPTPFAHSTAEIYDPATGTWTMTGAMHDPHGDGATMVTLPDGRQTIVGGFFYGQVDATAGTYSDPTYSRSVETYDAATGTWTKNRSTIFAHAGHVSAALADGSVLVAGGYGAGSVSERGVPRPLLPGEADTPAGAPDGTDTPDGGDLPRVSPHTTGFARPTSPQHGVVQARSTRLTLSRSGTVALRLRCTGGAACNEPLVLRKRERVLARGTFKAAAGKSTTLRLKVAKVQRRTVTHRASRITLQLPRSRTVIAGTLRK